MNWLTLAKAWRVLLELVQVFRSAESTHKAWHPRTIFEGGSTFSLLRSGGTRGAHTLVSTFHVKNNHAT